MLGCPSQILQPVRLSASAAAPACAPAALEPLDGGPIHLAELGHTILMQKQSQFANLRLSLSMEGL
jgi:hypothetical protein